MASALQEAKARQELAEAAAKEAKLQTALEAAREAEESAEKRAADAKSEQERADAKLQLESAIAVTKGASKTLVEHKKEQEMAAQVNIVAAGGSAKKGYIRGILDAVC